MNNNDNKKCSICKHEFVPLEFYEFRMIDGNPCNLCLHCDVVYTDQVRRKQKKCFTCEIPLLSLYERCVNIDSNVLCIRCWCDEEDIDSDDSGFSTPDSETSEDFSSFISDDEA